VSELATVSIDRRDGALVVKLAGEVDLSNAEEVERKIATEVGEPDTTIVIDLSTVSYLDSAGIRVLFKLKNSVSETGGILRLVVPDEGIVQRVPDDKRQEPPQQRRSAKPRASMPGMAEPAWEMPPPLTSSFKPGGGVSGCSGGAGRAAGRRGRG